MSGFVDIRSAIKKTPKTTVRKTIVKPAKSQSLYISNLRKTPIVYNNRTMNYYTTVRKCHIDPILDIEVDPQYSFKYGNQWDPYTGEIFGEDPYGSLYFHPACLVHYFYSKRLDGLWKAEEDTPEGHFAGYYDQFVASGENLDGDRGSHPEHYLFRLPIQDCYLESCHDCSLITMGPKLSDQDVLVIDELCKNSGIIKFYGDNFNHLHEIPSMYTLKYIYDMAISKNIMAIDVNDIERLRKFPMIDRIIGKLAIKKYDVPQHFYVDLLKKM